MNDPFWFIFPSIQVSDTDIETLRRISPKAKRLVEQNERLKEEYLKLYRFKADFDKFVNESGYVHMGEGPFG